MRYKYLTGILYLYKWYHQNDIDWGHHGILCLISTLIYITLVIDLVVVKTYDQ